MKKGWEMREIWLIKVWISFVDFWIVQFSFFACCDFYIKFWFMRVIPLDSWDFSSQFRLKFCEKRLRIDWVMVVGSFENKLKQLFTNNSFNLSKFLILRWFFVHLSFNIPILWLCQKNPKNIHFSIILHLIEKQVIFMT